jgi:hypothetical protein
MPSVNRLLEQILEQTTGGESFPPTLTGQNLAKGEIIIASSNITDSVAGTDIDTFVVALHDDDVFFPNPIYDVGTLDIDLTEMKFTNVSGSPFSFTTSIGGKLTSNSTSNGALVGVRINSTTGAGTGTEKTYSAGPTGGPSTVRSGFTTIGAFTLQNGESIWLEVSKNVAGTLVVDNALFIIKPLW